MVRFTMWDNHMLYIKDIEYYVTQIKENYKQLHMYSELGLMEIKTSKFIKECLSKYGVEFVQAARTGVIGILKGGRPPSGQKKQLR